MVTAWQKRQDQIRANVANMEFETAAKSEGLMVRMTPKEKAKLKKLTAAMGSDSMGALVRYGLFKVFVPLAEGEIRRRKAEEPLPGERPGGTE